MMIDWLLQVIINILLLSKIKSSHSLDSKTRPHVSLYLLNDNKVMVDLDDGIPWRIIKTATNQYELRSVMCRQLGLGPPISPGYTYDPSFLLHETVIVADAFLCTGLESELSECPMQKLNQSILAQRSLYSSTYYMELNCLPSEEQEFSVVLQREYSYKDVGVPLIFFEGRWGPLCLNKTSTDEFYNLNVLCKQLGFDRATDFPYSFIADVVFWPPVLLEVSCTGEERNIQECAYSKNLRSKKCHAFTRISCGSSNSTVSTNVRHSAFRPAQTTQSVVAPDKSTNIGLSVFILCLIILVGGSLLCCICVFCWKLMGTPASAQAPPHAHHADHLVFQTPGAIERSSLQFPSQERSQYITDVSPQYPCHPSVPAKDPELPTYEEAVKDPTNLNNVTVL